MKCKTGDPYWHCEPLVAPHHPMSGSVMAVERPACCFCYSWANNAGACRCRSDMPARLAFTESQTENYARQSTGGPEQTDIREAQSFVLDVSKGVIGD